MSKSNFLIYKHTSPSGKSYIGQTNNYARRNHSHKTTNNCSLFSRAISKYGWDSFTHEILAKGLAIDEANALEAKFISEHSTMAPLGYNLMTGGDNSLASELTKEKMSLVRKGRKKSKESVERTAEKNRGKKRSEEVKRRMSEIAKSRQVSQETREKMSKSRTGKKASEETKRRMSEAMKGRVITEEARIKIAESLRGRKVPRDVVEKANASRQLRRQSMAGVETATTADNL